MSLVDDLIDFSLNHSSLLLSVHIGKYAQDSGRQAVFLCSSYSIHSEQLHDIFYKIFPNVTYRVRSPTDVWDERFMKHEDAVRIFSGFSSSCKDE